MTINVPRVCSLQVAERPKQSSLGCGAAPRQGEGLSAAASILTHTCSSNQMTSTSTETLGNGAASHPETSSHHKAGLCARNCQTPSVVRTGSGHPPNLALNLGYYSEEEKQDQPKDEPSLELRQQEGCECKLCRKCSVTVNKVEFCLVGSRWSDGVDGVCRSLSALEPVVDLQYVKNDWYEKGTDLMVVNVYMKGISRDTARVIFREQAFTLFFQTR